MVTFLTFSACFADTFVVHAHVQIIYVTVAITACLVQEMFPAADGFFQTFSRIRSIRDTLSPHTILDCDEMGSILPNDNDASPPPIHPLYWPASGALFAYEFGHLAGMV